MRLGRVHRNNRSHCQFWAVTRDRSSKIHAEMTTDPKPSWNLVVWWSEFTLHTKNGSLRDEFVVKSQIFRTTTVHILSNMCIWKMYICFPVELWRIMTTTPSTATLTGQHVIAVTQMRIPCTNNPIQARTISQPCFAEGHKRWNDMPSTIPFHEITSHLEALQSFLRAGQSTY